ncbi:MAG: DUF6088 family protein, partial [Bacillales bacterium]|nr:DUF6088 family protein [Bacillales bacterium]
VNKISKINGWKILPNEEIALNRFGLSTQIPACYEYFSSGPYKKYKINNFVVEFKHISNKITENLSFTTGMVYLALKSLGRNNVNQNTILKIKRNLIDQEIDKVIAEIKNTRTWMYEKVKEMKEYD